jgi:hypothetical protein
MTAFHLIWEVLSRKPSSSSDPTRGFHLGSLSAFADFDTETATLDLPNMRNRKPEAIKTLS